MVWYYSHDNPTKNDYIEKIDNINSYCDNIINKCDNLFTTSQENEIYSQKLETL